MFDGQKYFAGFALNSHGHVEGLGPHVARAETRPSTAVSVTGAGFLWPFRVHFIIPVRALCQHLNAG